MFLAPPRPPKLVLLADHAVHLTTSVGEDSLDRPHLLGGLLLRCVYRRGEDFETLNSHRGKAHFASLGVA